MLGRNVAREVAVELDYIQQRRRWRRNGAIAGGVIGVVLAAMLFLRLRGGGNVGRLKVVISPSGITVDGISTTVTGAVTACRTAGACDVWVTGDTREGDWQVLLQALVTSGVPFYVH